MSDHEQNIITSAEKPPSPKPRGRRRRRIAVIAATAIAILSAIVFLVALYPSLFIQDPWKAIPRATPEEIAKVHEPEALRADLLLHTTRPSSHPQMPNSFL